MTDHPADPDAIDYAARTAELERELADTRSTADARLLRSELKTEAVRAGILDLDGLKLLDTSGLKLTAEGTLFNAPEIMNRLRRDKPWLFSKPNTSYPAPPPQSEPPKTRMAKEMSHNEWQTARDRLIRGR